VKRTAGKGVGEGEGEISRCHCFPPKPDREAEGRDAWDTFTMSNWGFGFRGDNLAGEVVGEVEVPCKGGILTCASLKKALGRGPRERTRG